MSDEVSTEAAIWLARIERGLQPHEGAQLSEWLKTPEHRDSIVSSAKVYHGPDILAVLAELVPVGFGNPAPPLPRQPRVFTTVVGICLAFSLLVVPVLAVKRSFPGLFDSNYRPPPGTPPRGTHIYTTGAGETRTIQLPEGSEAILNGHSQVTTLYAAWVREATVNHGEVLFDVTRKWPRPILLFAGGRHFEALGGWFDVRVTGPKSVVLTVLEGTVTVKALPFHWPTTPAEARNFDPSIFADASVGPMQSALLDNGILSRRAVTVAEARSQLSWEPEQVVYVTP